MVVFFLLTEGKVWAYDFFIQNLLCDFFPHLLAAPESEVSLAPYATPSSVPMVLPGEAVDTKEDRRQHMSI